MSDLVFSIIMLTTFSSTFIFNGQYVRWKSGQEQKKGGITQSSSEPPPGEGSEKNVEQQEKPQHLNKPS